jgi:hypothetical protein
MILALFFFFNFAEAQQNFFNVPNSEITTQGHSFFQEQINVNSGTTSFNSTYDYGLAHEWEAGINVFGMNYDSKSWTKQENFYDRSAPLDPNLMLNTQRGFLLSEHIHAGIGAQAGSSFNFAKKSQLPQYYYGNLEFKAYNSELLLVAGVFHANQAYQGDGHGWLQLGLEFPIIEEKLHFIGDFFNGNTSISQSVLGLCYFPSHNYALSAGYQIPNPGTVSPHQVVLEFTALPEGDLTQGKKH